MTAPALDVDLARRFTRSATTMDSPVTPNREFRRWFAEQRRVNRFLVRPIPFDQLRGWRFESDTGNLVHDSGRFFSVEGLRVDSDADGPGSWSQPIINQPEIGVLGIAVREFDGVLHCLMQAKMEPGNLNTVQLSPTVQATRSNYTGVHKGRATARIEHFVGPDRGRVLVDVLQSEQAAWFHRKRNRNMIVELTGDVPVTDAVRWLTIGQLRTLLAEDNMVNMDARTVLSCIRYAAAADDPPGETPATAPEEYRRALRRSLRPGGELHPVAEIRSWLTGLRALTRLDQRLVPLNAVTGWSRSDHDISHAGGRHFRIIAADIRASNREVTAWTQPLLAPVERGLAALLVQRIDGVLHLLLQAMSEGGTADVAELAPTVQCQPGAVDAAAPADRPDHYDLVRAAGPEQIRYDTVQSEEGGRFHHAENRYLVVEVPPQWRVHVGERHRWLTVDQVADLLEHTGYLNIQARTLIAALHTTW